MGEHAIQRKVFTGIDIFKLISAVMVVLLHTVENSDFYANEIKFVLTQYAVPFFFIASGFFFHKGISNTSDKKSYFVKYELRLIQMFCIWALIIRMPFTIITYLEKYPDLDFIKLGAIIFRRVVIIGPGPYWYLTAMICSTAFLYVCDKKGRLKLLVFSIVFGLMLEVLYSNFRGVCSQIGPLNSVCIAFDLVFSWKNNFVMYGIPFMGMGYVLAKKNVSCSIKTAAIGTIVSTLGCVLEYNISRIFSSMFWNSNSLSFFFIPQALFVFLLSKQWKPNVAKEKSIGYRQLSTCIYFAHFVFLNDILNPFINTYTSLPTYSTILILPKMILVLLACFLLFIMIKRINCRYLNVLING